eukprot:TRINITY_DN24319_c0_g1_i3.p2 TRINITY_DN24319_c0_g1~~TRINITY_DN24319_c0_g1_i3.p2  ORF type:complete len:260 (+),score=69.66 TRINITY_DN24319_c0_g1_i3:130-909(+)
MQGQGSWPESQAMLDALAPHVLALPLTGSHARATAQCMSGLLALSHSGDTPAVRALLAATLPKARRGAGTLPQSNIAARALRQAVFLAGDPSPPCAGLPGAVSEGSKRERAVAHLCKVAGVPGLQFAVAHSCGFELDLLCGKTHVEFTGPSLRYHADGKRRLMRLRDAALLQHFGISTVYIDLHTELTDVIRCIGDAVGAAEATGPAAGAWRRAEALAAQGWIPALRNAAGMIGFWKTGDNLARRPLSRIVFLPTWTGL